MNTDVESCIEKLASKLKIDISKPKKFSIAEVSGNALKEGVRTETVKDADEQMPVAQTVKNGKKLVDKTEEIIR